MELGTKTRSRKQQGKGSNGQRGVLREDQEKVKSDLHCEGEMDERKEGSDVQEQQEWLSWQKK